MKKKNLLQTVLFVIAFVMLNQFANAQCGSSKICMCIYYGPEFPYGCKCVSQSQVAHLAVRGYVKFPSTYCSGKRLSAPATQDETGHFSIYPNPVVNSTTIFFSLLQQEAVSLKLFDVNGRLIATVADKLFEEGDNEIEWSAADVNAGIYFLQFQSVEFSKMEKLIVTK